MIVLFIYAAAVAAVSPHAMMLLPLHLLMVTSATFSLAAAMMPLRLRRAIIFASLILIGLLPWLCFSRLIIAALIDATNR